MQAPRQPLDVGSPKAGTSRCNALSIAFFDTCFLSPLVASSRAEGRINLYYSSSGIAAYSEFAEHELHPCLYCHASDCNTDYTTCNCRSLVPFEDEGALPEMQRIPVLPPHRRTSHLWRLRKDTVNFHEVRLLYKHLQMGCSRVFLSFK